jgi:hypothetical protein
VATFQDTFYKLVKIIRFLAKRNLFLLLLAHPSEFGRKKLKADE